MIYKSPLLSIITPTYNRPLLLENCLKHVSSMQARGLNCEIIVVDSSEGSESKKLAKSYNARYVWFQAGKDLGRVEWKLFVGINYARGLYCTYLADDDYFMEEKLKKTLQFLQENSQIHACFYPFEKWNDNTNSSLNKINSPWNLPSTEFSFSDKWDLIEKLESQKTFSGELWIMKTYTAILVCMQHIPFLDFWREIIYIYKVLSFGNVYISNSPIYRLCKCVRDDLKINCGKERKRTCHEWGPLFNSNNRKNAYKWVNNKAKLDTDKQKNNIFDSEKAIQERCSMEVIRALEHQIYTVSKYDHLGFYGFQDPKIISGKIRKVPTAHLTSLQIIENFQVITPTPEIRQNLLLQNPECFPSQVLALTDVIQACDTPIVANSANEIS